MASATRVEARALVSSARVEARASFRRAARRGRRYELGAGARPAEAALGLPVAPPAPPESDLRTEVHKIQGVILSLHERLLAVEARGT